MRTLVNSLAAVGLLGAIGSAYADNDLLQKKNCFACHSVDKRKYGPKLNEVAAKYAGDKNAEKRLATKIRNGGTGVWGVDIMPPPTASDPGRGAGFGPVRAVFKRVEKAAAAAAGRCCKKGPVIGKARIEQGRASV